MKSLFILLAIVVVLVIPMILIGCQTTSIINTLTPSGGFTLQKDQPYGPAPRQTLDIYTPKNKPLKSAVVVFIHGGSWATGDKDKYLFVGQAFTELGYITVIPNYRLYPQVEFPAFIDDAAAAIAGLNQLLPQQACPDIRNIILVGHSAGAHTVAMLATEPKYLKRNHADVTLQAWVGMAGPYDLPLDDSVVADKFSRVTNDTDANPLNLASAATPPALLLHGKSDKTVVSKHTEKLSARLQALKVPVTTHFYAKTNHTKLAGGLAKPLRFLNPAYRDIADYLHRRELDTDCL